MRGGQACCVFKNIREAVFTALPVPTTVLVLNTGEAHSGPVRAVWDVPDGESRTPSVPPGCVP